MPLTEIAGVALSGELEVGPYSPVIFLGTASQSYTGAATCKTKVVKKGKFTGSAVGFG